MVALRLAPYAPRAAATTFARRVAEVVGGDDVELAARRGSRLPSSTFVPSSRTTSGTASPTSFAAATTPFAMTSHFMMPPKMLTRIAFTFGSDEDDLERRRDLLLVGAAADVEEVRGLRRRRA